MLLLSSMKYLPWARYLLVTILPSSPTLLLLFLLFKDVFATSVSKVTPSNSSSFFYWSSNEINDFFTLIRHQQRSSPLLFGILSTRSRMLLMVSSFLKQDCEFNFTTPSIFVLVPSHTCTMSLMVRFKLFSLSIAPSLKLMIWIFIKDKIQRSE